MKTYLKFILKFMTMVFLMNQIEKLTKKQPITIDLKK